MERIGFFVDHDAEGKRTITLQYLAPDGTPRQEGGRAALIVNNSNQQDESSMFDKHHDTKTWKNQRNTQRYNNKRMNMGNKRK